MGFLARGDNHIIRELELLVPLQDLGMGEGLEVEFIHEGQ